MINRKARSWPGLRREIEYRRRLLVRRAPSNRRVAVNSAPIVEGGLRKVYWRGPLSTRFEAGPEQVAARIADVSRYVILRVPGIGRPTAPAGGLFALGCRTFAGKPECADSNTWPAVDLLP